MPPSSSSGPHVVVLCAAQRGLALLERLIALLPAARLTVFSFREEGQEPPYFEAVREATLRHGGRFHESRKATEGPGREVWTEPIDVVFLAHWRYRLPAGPLNAARRGAFVFHDSLLPAYRGFSPTVWAMINGEPRCGATLFRLAEEIDAGPIVGQLEILIGPDETIADVVRKGTAAYLRLLEAHLVPILEGRAETRAQDARLATYTCKRTPEDNCIDWTRPGRAVYDLIRAVTHPYPGAFSYLREKKLIIWSARPCPSPKVYVGSVPGRVAEVRRDGVVVLTGDGSLLAKTVQLDGESEAAAADVLTSLGIRLQ